MRVGEFKHQPEGYQAFIPGPFPPREPLVFPIATQLLLDQATTALGKLDGITQLLPNLDFFILMYLRKEARLSSEIEGTKATLADVIRAEAEIANEHPQDTLRISKYVEAMRYGLKRTETLPLSLRFIKELHKVLLEGTADAPGKTPGEFRHSQNWIGGPTPSTARFVPPPYDVMLNALREFEAFLHVEGQFPSLVKAALAHAQFETIHPFLDGNGRTGRLLTTLFLCRLQVLEQPVLYLSAYFLTNRQAYYDSLHAYHSAEEGVVTWCTFFFAGVLEVATEAVSLAKAIHAVAQEDLKQIQKLGRRAESASIVLQHLYELPIITTRTVEIWLGVSTPTARSLILKLIGVGILKPVDAKKRYARAFVHSRYFDLF